MIRRAPEAILTSLKMDPARRLFYVEGHRDRLFFSWLVADEKHQDAAILDIDSVEISPDDYGGNRERLIAFANIVADGDADIHSVRCFADADTDRLRGRTLPPFVWLTDGRDLEGYLLCVPCIDKVLRLGVATELINAKELLGVVHRYGRKIGLLRHLSDSDNLALPFQRTELRKYLKIIDRQLELRFTPFLKALVQNAGISLSRIQTIQDKLVEVENELRDFPDEQLIHGKDAICIIERALSRHGLKSGEGEKLLWTSYDPKLISAGSNLALALEFLKTGCLDN